MKKIFYIIVIFLGLVNIVYAGQTTVPIAPTSGYCLTSLSNGLYQYTTSCGGGSGSASAALPLGGVQYSAQSGTSTILAATSSYTYSTTTGKITLNNHAGTFGTLGILSNNGNANIDIGGLNTVNSVSTGIVIGDQNTDPSGCDTAVLYGLDNTCTSGSDNINLFGNSNTAFDSIQDGSAFGEYNTLSSGVQTGALYGYNLTAGVNGDHQFIYGYSVNGTDNAVTIGDSDATGAMTFNSLNGFDGIGSSSPKFRLSIGTGANSIGLSDTATSTFPKGISTSGLKITNILNSVLGTDANGNVIATTSSGGSGTNYFTNVGSNTYLNTGTNLQALTLNSTSTTGTSTIAGPLTASSTLAIGTSSVDSNTVEIQNISSGKSALGIYNAAGNSKIFDITNTGAVTILGKIASAGLDTAIAGNVIGSDGTVDFHSAVLDSVGVAGNANQCLTSTGGTQLSLWATCTAAAGSSMYIQFNSNNKFDATSTFTFSSSTGVLTFPSFIATSTNATSTVSGTLAVGTSSYIFGVSDSNILIKSGTNQPSGIATLSSGTVTVSNTSISTTSKVFTQDITGGANIGTITVATSTGSFTLTSTNILDNSNVEWFIFNGF